MKPLDLTGQKFGRLRTERRVNTPKKGTYWECLCDCGNKTIVFIGHLRSGKTESCGCYLNERIRTHGKSRSPEHISWCSMRNRCLSPTTNGYERYGGAGIRICKEWDNFEIFLLDMGERPSEKHTLDRINPFGDYTPENCRWSDKRTQSRNQINAKRWVVFGVEYETAKDAGDVHGVTGTTIRRWCKEKEDCWSYNLYGKKETLNT